MTSKAKRVIASMVSLGLIATACSTSSAAGEGAAEAVSATEANETAYIEAWQAADLDALMNTMTEDVLWVDETFYDYIEGKDAVRSMYSGVITLGDADGKDVIDRFVSSDGTRAASLWEWVGTNFSGQRFNLPIVLIHEYRDGKIVKETAYYASPNASEQLLGS